MSQDRNETPALRPRWNRRQAAVLALLAAVVLGYPLLGRGAVPGVIQFQGRATDAGGNPLNGSYDVEVRLYNDPAAGDLLYTDRRTTANGGQLAISNGIYYFEVGGGSGVAGTRGTVADCFRYESQVYLEVKIGTETLSPRVPVLATGYAIQADYLDGYDSSQFVLKSENKTIDSATTITSTDPTSWYNASWTRRRLITVDNTGNATAHTNYCVRHKVAYDADMQADFDDIRYTLADGVTLVDHWRQTYTASTSAVFMIEVPTLPASGTVDLYLYYGNASASSASNMAATFLFSDDFDDGVIDPGKWTEIDNGGYLSESGGQILATGGNSVWTSNGLWSSSMNFDRTGGLALELRYRKTSGINFMFGWKDNGAGTSYTDLIYGYYDSGGPWVYEDGASRGGAAGTWTVNQWYVARVAAKPGSGCRYEQSANDGDTWTTSYNSSYSSESPVRIGLFNYSEAFWLDDVRVRKYSFPEPSISGQTTEQNASGTFNLVEKDATGTATVFPEGIAPNYDSGWVYDTNVRHETTFVHNLGSIPRQMSTFFSPDGGTTVFKAPDAGESRAGAATSYTNPMSTRITDTAIIFDIYEGTYLYEWWSAATGNWTDYSTGYWRVLAWK